MQINNSNTIINVDFFTIFVDIYHSMRKKKAKLLFTWLSNEKKCY
jgi:hypothetical protein